MAYISNNYEAASNGTTITVGNSDDNGAGDALAVATGGTRIYSTAWAHEGTCCADLSATSGNTVTLGFTQTDAAGMSVRQYFRVPSLPSATCAIFQMRDSADAARGSLQLRADGKIEVVSHSDGVVYTTTTAISTSTTYRLEWRQAKGSGTGKVGFGLYAGDSTTPLDSFSSSAMSPGTNDFVAYRFGKLTGIASTFQILFDVPAMEDQGDTLLGPLTGLTDLQYDAVRLYRVDATDSVGVVTLTQLSGTSCVVTEVSSKVFEILVPEHPDPLWFQLVADGDGPAISDTFPIRPDTSTTIRRLRAGGDPTVLSDWV